MPTMMVLMTVIKINKKKRKQKKIAAVRIIQKNYIKSKMQRTREN